MKRFLAITLTLVLLIACSVIPVSALASNAPAAPTGVKAVSASATSIAISWTAVKGVSGYAVFIATSSKGAFSAIGTSTTPNLTKSALKTNTTYYFKVRSYVGSGAARVYSKDSAIVSAKPVAPPTTVAADYKGVVFYVQNTILQLSPEGFTLNFGTPDELHEKKGQSTMHLPYVWQENCPDYITTSPDKATFAADMKLAPRYFRVSLTKAQKLGAKADANFRDATAKGETPGFNFAWDTLPVGAVSLPKATTKVFFDSWIQDYTMSNKYLKTDYVNQAALYVSKLDVMYQGIIKARPGVKFYASSMGLVCETFPRIDTHPTDAMMNKWGQFFGGLMDFKTKMALNVPFRKEVNKQLKALCAKKGYIYVDLEQAGLTNADGMFLEKYAHINGVGVQFNQAGLTKYGDYVCTAMGLKTAKVMYGLK